MHIQHTYLYIYIYIYTSHIYIDSNEHHSQDPRSLQGKDAETFQSIIVNFPKDSILVYPVYCYGTLIFLEDPFKI